MLFVCVPPNELVKVNALLISFLWKEKKKIYCFCIMQQIYKPLFLNLYSHVLLGNLSLSGKIMRSAVCVPTKCFVTVIHKLLPIKFSTHPKNNCGDIKSDSEDEYESVCVFLIRYINHSTAKIWVRYVHRWDYYVFTWHTLTESNCGWVKNI